MTTSTNPADEFARLRAQFDEHDWTYKGLGSTEDADHHGLLVWVSTPDIQRLQPSRSRCSCQKFAYTSRKVALGAAALARLETGETIHAYRCEEGHCFHIGHPIGTNGRPIPEPEETP